jgi:hypothetical protein
LSLLATAALTAFGAPGGPENAASIDAKTTGVRYCTERDGKIAAHLYLDLEYSNRTNVPVLVPMFARISSYSVFKDPDQYRRGQEEDRIQFRRPNEDEMPDLTPTPAATLFSTLPVGEQLRRNVVVKVAIGAGRHRIPLGADRLIDIEVDHWPRSPEIGLKLREEWKARGDVLTSKVRLSSPIKIRVEKNPVPSPCGMQVD